MSRILILLIACILLSCHVAFSHALMHPERLPFQYSQIPEFSLRTLLRTLPEAESHQDIQTYQVLPIQTYDSSIAHLIQINNKYLFYVSVSKDVSGVYVPLAHHITIDMNTIPKLSLCTQYQILQTTESNGLKLLYFYVAEPTGSVTECSLFVWDENESTATGDDATIVHREESIWVHEAFLSPNHHKLWFLGHRRDVRNENEFIIVQGHFVYGERGNNLYDTLVKDARTGSAMIFEEYHMPVALRGAQAHDWNACLVKPAGEDRYMMATIRFVDGEELKEGFELRNLTLGVRPGGASEEVLSFEDFPFVFIMEREEPLSAPETNNEDPSPTTQTKYVLFMSDGWNRSIEIHQFDQMVTQDDLSNAIFVDADTLLITTNTSEQAIIYKCSPSSPCEDTSTNFTDSSQPLPLSTRLHRADFEWNFFSNYEALNNTQLDSIHRVFMTNHENLTLYSLLNLGAPPTELINNMTHVEWLFSVGSSAVIKYTIDSSDIAEYWWTYPSNDPVQPAMLFPLGIEDALVLSVMPHPDHETISIVTNSTIDGIVLLYATFSYAQGCTPACNSDGGYCNLTTLQCECQPQFRGDTCFQCAQPAMIGSQCNYYCNMSDNCVHGECNTDKGICECYSDPVKGYWKDATPDSTEHCSVCKSSNFDASANCLSCSEGWTHGPAMDCEVPTCFGIAATNSSAICAGHGKCVQPDRCECDQTALKINFWTGIDCSKPTCFGYPADNPNACHGNGLCTEWNVCQCESGFFGLDCDEFEPVRSMIWLIVIAAGLGAMQLVLVVGLVLYLCGSHLRGGTGGRGKFSSVPGRRPVNLDAFSDGELLIDEEEDDEDDDSFLRNDNQSFNEESNANASRNVSTEPAETTVRSVSAKDTVQQKQKEDEDFGLQTDSDDDSQLILV